MMCVHFESFYRLTVHHSSSVTLFPWLSPFFILLKNVWEFRARVDLDGSRGGVNLRISVFTGELDHETMNSACAIPLEIEVLPGKSEIFEKVVDEHGTVIERSTGQEIDSERIMRAHEFFLKVAKQKGLDLIRTGIEELLQELSLHGKSQNASGGTGE